jgi:hypothetical protein
MEGFGGAKKKGTGRNAVKGPHLGSFGQSFTSSLGKRLQQRTTRPISKEDGNAITDAFCPKALL